MLSKGSDAARGIVDLYGTVDEPGFSIGQISRFTGYTHSTLWCCLEREGVERRPVGGAHDRPALLPHSEVRRRAFLYERMGYSIREVALVVGRSYTSVRASLVKAGVKLRTGSEGQRVRTERIREHGERLARLVA